MRLVHWHGPEGRELKQRLVSLGHDVAFDDVDRLALMRRLRGEPPDAVVIDLSRLPSQGREVALALRGARDTRAIPIVFVEGDPQKVRALKALLPDATYTSWGRVNTAVARAIARPPAAPVIPPPSIYSAKPLAEKLGIKEGMRVVLVGAPPGFASILEPLPAGVRLSAKADSAADLYVAVARGARELVAHFTLLARTADRQTLWTMWPKKASRVKSDLDGNVVRETGLAAGWVDFKVCSVDDTWSALAFKRRR